MRIWALSIPICLALSVGLLFFLSTARPVYAADWDNDTISITQIATRLGQALGFSADALLIGGIILGCIFLLMAMLPTVFIVRKTGAANMYIMIVGIAITSMNIAMTIFPWWILLLLAMLIALMFAGSVRGWITGRAGE